VYCGVLCMTDSIHWGGHMCGGGWIPIGPHHCSSRSAAAARILSFIMSFIDCIVTVASTGATVVVAATASVTVVVDATAAAAATAVAAATATATAAGPDAGATCGGPFYVHHGLITGVISMVCVFMFRGWDFVVIADFVFAAPFAFWVGSRATFQTTHPWGERIAIIHPSLA
jgi:hypothetical protein